MPYRHDDLGYREKDWFWCWRWWNAFGYKDTEICVSDDNENEPFNRSRARNNAVAKSSGSILVFADADTVVDQIALAEAVREVANRRAPWVIPYQWYYNLSQEYTDKLHENEKPHRIAETETDFSYEHRILSWAGILVVPREAYDQVGGYDERFEGWGHEDVAFRIKLDAEYGKHTRTEGNAYHLWHPINPKQTFNSPNELANRRLFVEDYVRKYNWKDERLSK